MMRRSGTFSFALLGMAVVALAAASCGRDMPPAPTLGLDGTWRGTITRGVAGGTISLQLTQSGAGVTGTWSADLTGSTFDQSGSASGTVTASGVSLFLTPGAPTVCGPDSTLSGTLTMNGRLAGDQLAGDYVVFACGGVDTGRIDLTRD